MKKIILSLILFTTSIKGFSQRHWGAYFAGTYNYRTINEYNDVLKTHDQSMMGFNAGVSLRLPIKMELSFVTGLDFAQQTLERNVKYIIADPSLPAGSPPVQFSYMSKSWLGYLGVPTALHYTFLSGKWFAAAEIGAVHKLLITGAFKRVSPVEASGPSSLYPVLTPDAPKQHSSFNELQQMRFRMYNADLLGAIKVGVRLKSLLVGLAPEVRYALWATTKDDRRNEHLYSLGVKVFVEQ